MKAVTNEWLDHAWRDLEAATRLVTTEYLTGIAVFHAQQAVEKSLKAIIEEFEIGHIKTHDLQRLHAMTKSWLDLDQTSLDILNTVYIDARYPAELGLLPDGLPSTPEANELLRFAEETYTCVRDILERYGQGEDSGK